MTYEKQIKLYAYEVEFVDLRAPKPREHLIEMAIYDDERINALSALGLNVTDYIEKQFNIGGFHVISIKKAARQQATISLQALYFSKFAEEVE